MRPQFVREHVPGASAWPRALSHHRTLLRFALGMIHIFAWIFTFEFFYYLQGNANDALFRTVLLYTLSQIVTCLITPYSAQFLRLGTRRSLIFGTALVAVAFVLLNGIFQGFWHSTQASCGIVVFAVLVGLYRALYWVPYEVEAQSQRRGGSSLVSQVIVALAPLVGGILITGWVLGPVLLLYIGAFLIAVSTSPLLFVRDVYEKFSWGYRETFTRLFEPEHRVLVKEAFFDGIAGAALLFFWPFTIFLLVGRSYDTLGVVLSITFLIALVLRRVVRRFMRDLKVANAPVFETVLAVTPWLFRLAIATPVGMILADSYFYTTTKRTMGADPYVFEQVADGGTYVDEFTALKEIAMALGRITLCLIAAITLTLSSVSTTLVIVLVVAAVVTTASVWGSYAR